MRLRRHINNVLSTEQVILDHRKSTSYPMSTKFKYLNAVKKRRNPGNLGNGVKLKIVQIKSSTCFHGAKSQIRLLTTARENRTSTEVLSEVLTFYCELTNIVSIFLPLAFNVCDSVVPQFVFSRRKMMFQGLESFKIASCSIIKKLNRTGLRRVTEYGGRHVKKQALNSQNGNVQKAPKIWVDVLKKFWFSEKDGTPIFFVKNFQLAFNSANTDSQHWFLCS